MAGPIDLNSEQLKSNILLEKKALPMCVTKISSANCFEHSLTILDSLLNEDDYDNRVSDYEFMNFLGFCSEVCNDNSMLNENLKTFEDRIDTINFELNFLNKF